MHFELMMSQSGSIQTTKTARHDLDAIVALVPAEARVLDLGCGEGALLEKLVRGKKVQARGVELSEDNVRACIGRGLSVRQGNIEEGLADYSNDAFDYVILSQTLSFLDHPQSVVREILRVGRHAVISFNNAGHWRTRRRALAGGGLGTTLLSGEPRERAITIGQFEAFVASLDARVDRAVFLSRNREVCCLPSLRAEIAVYVLKKCG